MEVGADSTTTKRDQYAIVDRLIIALTRDTNTYVYIYIQKYF